MDPKQPSVEVSKEQATFLMHGDPTVPPTKQDAGLAVNDPTEGFKEKIPFMFSNTGHARKGLKRVLHCEPCPYRQLCREASDLLQSKVVRDLLEDWDEKQSRKRCASHSPLEETQRRVRARNSSINPAVLGEPLVESMEDEEYLVEEEPMEEISEEKEVDYEEEVEVEEQEEDYDEEEEEGEEEEEQGEEEEEEEEEPREEEPPEEEEPIEEEPMEEWIEQDLLKEPIEEEPLEELIEQDLLEEPLEEEEPIGEEPLEELIEQAPLEEPLEEEPAEEPVDKVSSSYAGSCDWLIDDEITEEEPLYQVLSEEEISEDDLKEELNWRYISQYLLAVEPQKGYQL